MNWKLGRRSSLKAENPTPNLSRITYPTRRIFTLLLLLSHLFCLLALLSPTLRATPLPLCENRVVISEIMYNPIGGDAFEFIEIYNPGATPLNLANYSFSGITYKFPLETWIRPGDKLVIVADVNRTAVQARYKNTFIWGYFTGKLDNAGELIKLNDPSGKTVTAVEYDDDGFWAKQADGGGYSIEIVDPAAAPSDPGNWRRSVSTNGSGGVLAAHPPRTLYISEIRAGGGVLEGEATTDFVELHNSGAAPAPIGGWTLSDNTGNTRRFIFPAETSIPAGERLVVWFTKAAVNGLRTDFGLENERGVVGLWPPDGTIGDVVSYGPQLPEGSITKTAAGWKFTKASPGALGGEEITFGDPSALRINEWYTDSVVNDPDWVELHNPDPLLPVNLVGLRLRFNTVCHEFKLPGAISPGGFVVFRATGEATAPDTLPFKLSSTGGTFSLETPALAIDRLTIGTQSERQSQGRSPDGGDNLEFFPHPTPGESNSGDRDRDGLPDWWESEFSAFIPDEDWDLDGASNLAEYLAGTRPDVRGDVLKVFADPGASGVTVSFEARADKSYVVESSEQPSGAEWASEFQVEAGPHRAFTGSITPEHSARWFRVRVLTERFYPNQLALQFTPKPAQQQVDTGTEPVIIFNQPLAVAQVKTNTFTLTDDLNRKVAGSIRWTDGFTRAEFKPAIPLHHSSTYKLAVDPAGLRGLTGATLATATNISFSTLAAPELKDNPLIYTNDFSIPDLEATVFPGVFTLAEVHADTEVRDNLEPYVNILFRAPGFAQQATQPNATLELRGRTSRRSTLKSYKIRLQGDETWGWTSNVELAKQPFDLSRIRNRLNYDLLAGTQFLPSTRSAFARFRLNGTNQGFYTRLESPNNAWLEARGWSKDAHFYKAQSFGFRIDPGMVKTTDPTYSKFEFELRLEIQGIENHDKMLAMLGDIANNDIPINRIVDKHFHRPNYVTWLAWNMLTQNIDTLSQNFYLYSPKNSSAWYFIPWDYDGAWGFYTQVLEADNPRPTYDDSFGHIWSITLHRRFLTDPANLAAVFNRMDELLAGPLAEDRIRTLVEIMRPIVGPEVLKVPDLNQLAASSSRLAPEQWNAELTRLITYPKVRRQTLATSLEKPMPVTITSTPTVTNGNVTFTWTASFDFQGDALSYDFQLGTSPHFTPETVVAERKNLAVRTLTLPVPPPGQYYYRVLIRDAKGNQEMSFSSITYEGKTIFGVRTFTF